MQLEEILYLLSKQTQSYTFQEAIAILKSMDSDGSGAIDYHEFLAQFASPKQMVQKKVVEEIFQHFDCNNDGYIDESEFKT